MVGDIIMATRTEALGAIRSRYKVSSKKDKSKMLDEFVAIAGRHRNVSEARRWTVESIEEANGMPCPTAFHLI